MYIHRSRDIHSMDKMPKNFNINQFIVLFENKVGVASGMHCMCL